MSDMVNLLRVKDLKCGNILNGLSFSIKEKTFNILIGKNGIGKTTLVKSILGLTKYTGEIEFKYDRKDIGVISDFTSITEDTVFKYLMQPLLNLEYSEERARKAVYNNAKKLGIDHLLEQSGDRLNDEQTLMVLLCHTLIHKPKLIIIDNTLDALSNRSKKLFLSYLFSFKQTVIFVTNDSRYFKYANRLLIMTRSNVQEIKQSKSLNSLERKLLRSNSELPFSLELSSKLYSYGIVDKLYNDNSELVNDIWK